MDIFINVNTCFIEDSSVIVVNISFQIINHFDVFPIFSLFLNSTQYKYLIQDILYLFKTKIFCRIIQHLRRIVNAINKSAFFVNYIVNGIDKVASCVSFVAHAINT